MICSFKSNLFHEPFSSQNRSEWFCSQIRLNLFSISTHWLNNAVTAVSDFCTNHLFESKFSENVFEWFKNPDLMIHSQWAAGILLVNKINCIALFVTQSSCMTEDGRLLWRIYKLFETWKLQSTFMHGKSNQHLRISPFVFMMYVNAHNVLRWTIPLHGFSLKISTENDKTSADPIWGYWFL